MELKKLYPIFFDEKKRFLAYENEEKYWQDLFCYPASLISIKILMKFSNEQDEIYSHIWKIKIDQMFLRHLAVWSGRKKEKL